MKKTLLIILFFSYLAFSAVSDFKIEGVVISYDKTKVVLAQDSGRKIKVRRASIPEHYKIKRGERVHAVISNKKILKAIKKGG